LHAQRLLVAFIQSSWAIGPPPPFKVGWHNSSIVQRSGTGGSPFSSVAISKLFNRVGSTRDLLRIEENPEEEEEDPEEDPEEDDDDDMEMDDEAEVIDPYMDDGLNNPPLPNSEDEETPPTSLVIPDADGQHIPPIALFGQNFHFGESSSTANLLIGNSKIVPTGPMCSNLGTAWKRLGKMEKHMSERIDT
nr:hypothetical protein [Tanacetum cinerariifolium]